MDGNVKGRLCTQPACSITALVRGLNWGGDVKQRRPLLSLIAFCTTSVLVTSLAFVLIFAGATVILAFARTLGSAGEPLRAATQMTTETQPNDVAVDSANAIIFEGVISDDHCKARHDMGSGKSPAECTQLCTREGADYVIINGGQMYRLTGRDDLAILAGERVTVTGVRTGDTIKVKAISTDH